MEAAGRWEALKRRYAQAIKLPPDERVAFLDKTCPPELRPELDSLLANYEENPDGFEPLAGDAAAAILEALMEEQHKDAHDGRYPLIGQTLSHYQVIEGLGGGGMGVVYKAYDTKLKHVRALKFLPPHLSTSDEAKERFSHEARAASALDHPNICTIHEIGETDDGQLFIAMAYYEGETLKKKIERGPLPLDEALDYAAQVARGLAKAHAHGIIHRDIKPANVIVTEPAPAEAEGIAKILDFGLAKMADVQLTQTGARMGTVAYMSPEQARGDKVDHRTDIWSLGAVLYEMLTGERPFMGDYPEAVIYSVLHETPPPITEINPDVPADLDHVVEMCLEKDKALRYPSAADLLVDLEHLHSAPPLRAPLIRRSLPRRTRWMIGGVAAVILALLLLFLSLITRKTPLEDLRLAVLFENVGRDASQQAFNEWLGLRLTHMVTQMKQFSNSPMTVVPASEVSGIPTVAEARRKFSVQRAITLSVMHEGDQVQLILRLVDAEKLTELESATIAGAKSDVTSLEEALVNELAQMLAILLPPEAYYVLTTGGTVNSRAYDFYKIGRLSLEGFETEKDIDTAIDFFRLAFREDSLFAPAYAGLGEAYWHKYQNSRDAQWITLAEQSYSHAVRLDVQLAPTYVTAGLLNTATGEYEKAIEEFRFAIVIDSTNADAYRGLAKAYEADGRLTDAELTYKKGIQAKLEYWAGYNDLGVFYYRQGRFEEATTQLEQVAELSPSNTRGLNNLGGLYFHLGRKEEAFQMLERSIEIEPTYRGYSNLATLYYSDQQYTYAAQTYEKALAIEDTDYRIWGFLADAYYRTDKPDSARYAFDEAIMRAEKQLEVNPNDPEVLSNLASYYEPTGERDKALSSLQRVEALEPDNPIILFSIGYTYEQLGERELALKWIEMALEKGYSPEDIENAPELQALRADERYQRLLKRIKAETQEESSISKG